MPYIPQALRDELINPVDELAGIILSNYLNLGYDMAGQVNFVVSSLLVKLIKGRGLRYATINELVGALECCKLELYRRLAAPYEDEKIKENGDVF